MDRIRKTYFRFKKRCSYKALHDVDAVSNKEPNTPKEIGDSKITDDCRMSLTGMAVIRATCGTFRRGGACSDDIEADVKQLKETILLEAIEGFII